MISSRSSFGIIFGVSFHLQIPRSRGKEKVMSRRIPCRNSSVKYPVVVPSALKPPKFQQKLFLSIVLSLRHLPALGAPYTITAPPTPRGGPEVLLEDPLPPFVVWEPHPEHHHEHLQHLGSGWRGGLGAIAVPARSLGAASHQGTPAGRGCAGGAGSLPKRRTETM